jgi:Icc-related predicted phosphoesterase
MTSDLPGGPMIIHSGDVSSRGRFQETQDFIDWFASLPYAHKVFISGNHDFIFEKENNLTIPDSIHYLQDSAVSIEGIKIYGSPWQPWFYNWAFNLPRNGKELKAKWDAIPEDTDILVTHGPPFGILDKVARGGDHVGCELLIERIREIKPKISVFGHIHEGHGTLELEGTTFINASMLDHRYEYVNKPIIIDFPI